MKKPSPVYGIVDVHRWDTVIVLPIDDAAHLAQLIARGTVFQTYETGVGHAWSDTKPNGERPSFPSIEVIDQLEVDRRFAAMDEVKKRREAQAKADAEAKATDGGTF